MFLLLHLYGPEGQDEIAAGQEAIQKLNHQAWQSFFWPKSTQDVEEDEMADKHKLHNESRIRIENIQENLLIILVLVFSFIYFVFQLYLWFSSPQM